MASRASVWRVPGLIRPGGQAPNLTPYTQSDDLVRRVAVVDRLKLCLLVLVVLASGLGLLALAAFVVLTNKVALVSAADHRNSPLSITEIPQATRSEERRV